MKVTPITYVTLTEQDLIEAIVDHVSRQSAGEGPLLAEDTIRFQVGGNEATAEITASGSTIALPEQTNG